MIDFTCFDLVPEYCILHNSWSSNSLHGHYLLQTFAALNQHLNLSSGFSLLLIPLHLLCTHYLHNKLKTDLLPTLFLKTAKESFPLSFAFLVFSLLLIIFHFLNILLALLKSVLFSKLLVSLSNLQLAK